MLVGERDVGDAHHPADLRAAPLDDLLAIGRVDWRPNGADTLMLPLRGRARDRYLRQHLDPRHRLGVAAPARHATATTRSSAPGRASLSPRCSTPRPFSFSTFNNAIRAGRAGPAADVPEHPGRRILPRAAGHDAEAPAGRGHRHVGARRPHPPRRRRVQRVDSIFDLGVFQQGRIELVEDFATFDRNGDGRVDDNDLLFAVTLRSGKPDQRARASPTPTTITSPLFVQDDWRVRPTLTLNSACATSSTPTSRTSAASTRSTRSSCRSCRATRERDRNNFAPARRLQLGARRRPHERPRRLRHLLRPRSRSRSSRSNAGWTARAARSRCAPATSSSSTRATGRFPPFAPTLANPFTGFILPGAGASAASTSSTTACRTRWCSSATSAFSASSPRDFVAARRLRAQLRHALHHRPHDRRGLQPRGRRPRPRRQPGIEREDASTTGCS